MKSLVSFVVLAVSVGPALAENNPWRCAEEDADFDNYPELVVEEP